MKHQEQMYKLELLQREEKERKILENTISLAELEFARGIPLAAPTLFKALIHWDCFQLRNQNFPNKIIKTLKTTLRVKTKKKKFF